MRSITATTLACLMHSGSLVAQATPLPSDMICDMGDEPYGYIDKMQLAPPQPDEDTFCLLWFDTEDQTVSIAVTHWRPPTIADEPAHVRESHDVAYQPTAIAAASPRGTAFYVAGYSDRTGQVIVERWRFVNMATSAAIGPTGKEILGVTFGIRKELLLASSAIGPIASMTVHPIDGKVWLLQGSGSHALRRLDPANGTLQWIVDGTIEADLASAASLSTLWIDDTHASGGGVMIYGVNWRDWTGARHDAQVGDQFVGVAFYDTDEDGLDDQRLSLTYKDLGDLGFLDERLHGWTAPVP